MVASAIPQNYLFPYFLHNTLTEFNHILNVMTEFFPKGTVHAPLPA